MLSGQKLKFSVVLHLSSDGHRFCHLLQIITKTEMQISYQVVSLIRNNGHLYLLISKDNTFRYISNKMQRYTVYFI